jgi:RHS repeat-associated protein
VDDETELPNNRSFRRQTRITPEIKYSNHGHSFFVNSKIVKIIDEPGMREDDDEPFKYEGGMGTHLLTERDAFGNPSLIRKTWAINSWALKVLLGDLSDIGWVQDLMSIERWGGQETIERQYTNDTKRWLLGLLDSETILSWSPLCHVIESSGEPVPIPPDSWKKPPWYDGGPCPPGGKSRISSEYVRYKDRGKEDLLERIVIHPKDPDATLTIKLAYDAYGNTVSVTSSGKADVNGNEQSRQVSMVYDSQESIFPIRETNTLKQSVDWLYDRSLGQPISITGIDGRKITTHIDGFGRTTRESITGGDSVNYALSGPPATNNAVGFRILITTDSGAKSETYFDRLGRKIHAETLGYDGHLIYREFMYDKLGRLRLMKIPRFSGQPDTEYIGVQYDNFDRPTKISGRDGEVQIRYDPLVTYVTDPRGETASYIVNGAGDTIAVIDPSGNANRYYYGANQSLWRILDAAGQETGGEYAAPNLIAMDYDKIGRLIAISDPDTGLRNVQYNSFGEIISTSDAKRQSRTRYYDELGRLVQINDDDGTYQWTWDTASVSGRGKIGRAQSPKGHSEEYTYDNFGNLGSYRLDIDSSANLQQSQFEFKFLYDKFGRLYQTEYPKIGSYPQKHVRYAYDASGLVKSIVDESNKTVWRAIEYDAENRVTNEQYGNDLATKPYYYIRSGRLRGSSTSRGQGKPLLNQLFSYWPGGKLRARSLEINGDSILNEEIFYDAVGRLDKVKKAGGAEILNLDYDAIGNITNKSDIGKYRYKAQQPHAVTQAGARSYGYDANGNQIRRGGLTLKYTPFDKLARVQLTDAPVSLEYSAGEQRLLKITPDNTTVYVLDQLATVQFPTEKGCIILRCLRRLFNLDDGGDSVTKISYHIPGPGGRIVASFESEGEKGWSTRYPHYDHLGSVIAVTNASGDITGSWKYDAFGKQARLENGNAVEHSRGYTGTLLDDETETNFMGARQYDPELGRFLSADPLISDPLSTQGLNRYSYVQNDPLNATDPTGLCSFCWFEEGMIIEVDKSDWGDVPNVSEEDLIVIDEPPRPDPISLLPDVDWSDYAPACFPTSARAQERPPFSGWESSRQWSTEPLYQEIYNNPVRPTAVAPNAQAIVPKKPFGEMEAHIGFGGTLATEGFLHGEVDIYHLFASKSKILGFLPFFNPLDFRMAVSGSVAAGPALGIFGSLGPQAGIGFSRTVSEAGHGGQLGLYTEVGAAGGGGGSISASVPFQWPAAVSLSVSPEAGLGFMAGAGIQYEYRAVSPSLREIISTAHQRISAYLFPHY